LGPTVRDREAVTEKNRDLHHKKRDLEETIGRLILAFQTETGLRVAGLSISGVDTKIREAGNAIPAVIVDARL
jgi:hypothetical protein